MGVSCMLRGATRLQHRGHAFRGSWRAARLSTLTSTPSLPGSFWYRGSPAPSLPPAAETPGPLATAPASCSCWICCILMRW